MKKVLFLLASVILFASCHNYKKDVLVLNLQNDSITHELELRDSSIQVFFDGYNLIQTNLDSIKSIERLIAMPTNQQIEINSSQKIRILEDIKLINHLLQTNKEQIASLQSKLRNSNIRFENLQAAEVMLASVQNQNREKDAEITIMNETIEDLNFNIGKLSEEITIIESDYEAKVQTIIEQTDKMNQAFYAFGSSKELKKAGVMEKMGGIFGIGQTQVIKDNLNHDYFTPIDIRYVNYIPLFSKRAKLLSSHTPSSYHISGKNSADTLFIDNETEFWKVTKYLIILTD